LVSSFGPVPIAAVKAESQSPFIDVYPKNDIGLHLPVTAGKDAVAFARAMKVTGPTALLSMDVQLPTTASGEGYYLNMLGTGGGISFALGTSYAGAEQMRIFWTNDMGAKVQMLVPSDVAGVWYNIKIKMDFTAHKMVISITPHAGKTTEFTDLDLPYAMKDIGSWTYANATGPNPNPVNIDNVALTVAP